MTHYSNINPVGLLLECQNFITKTENAYRMICFVFIQFVKVNNPLLEQLSVDGLLFSSA